VEAVATVTRSLGKSLLSGKMSCPWVAASEVEQEEAPQSGMAAAEELAAEELAAERADPVADPESQ
jgi:hypothetical protein